MPMRMRESDLFVRARKEFGATGGSVGRRCAKSHRIVACLAAFGEWLGPRLGRVE